MFNVWRTLLFLGRALSLRGRDTPQASYPRAVLPRRFGGNLRRTLAMKQWVQNPVCCLWLRGCSDFLLASWCPHFMRFKLRSHLSLPQILSFAELDKSDLPISRCGGLALWQMKGWATFWSSTPLWLSVTELAPQKSREKAVRLLKKKRKEKIHNATFKSFIYAVSENSFIDF